MIELPTDAALPSPVALLADDAITDPTGRPVRYFDPFCFPPDTDLWLCIGKRDRTDEALEKRLGRIKNPRWRNYLAFVAAPLNVLRHWGELRRARSVICQAPHYFWLLIALWRLGVFRVRDKTIQTVFFRQRGFQRKLAQFASAPPEFEAGFAVREQICALETLGCPPGRLRYVPWKIDTGWFTPGVVGATATADTPYVLCPGDIQRDETLIGQLIGTVPYKIIRVGRSPALRDIYAAHARDAAAGRFELRVNVSHAEYRSLLREAALVVLPILPCDEPAGLTAALETLSCARPLLANDSPGVGPLLREVRLADHALVPGLDEDVWREAVIRVVRNPPPDAVRQAARGLTVSAHSLLPAGSPSAR